MAEQAVAVDDNADERRMLADSVAGFTQGGDALARARRLRDDGGHDRQAWAQLADMGWLGILAPEDSGGMALGVPEMAVVAEGLGRARSPEPFIAVAGLAATVIVSADNRSLGQQLLTELIHGRKLIAVAWQDAPDTPNATDVACRAEDDGSGVVLSGRKYMAVPAEADDFIVSARSPDGVALYRIPADAAGLGVTAQQQIDGSGVAALCLDRVAVEGTDRIASPAAAPAALERGLRCAEVLAAAELLGLADRLPELTMDYLGARKQFGQPLSAFQVLRHRTVNLYMQRELMRAALRHATRVLERQNDAAAARAASRAKARASEAAMNIAREAVQLHGAIGYTEEADVGIYLHRILVLNAWLGNADWHRRRYARLSRAPQSERRQ